MSDLVERLAANAGLYVGPQVDPTDPSGPPSVARIDVQRLPGGAGVSIDYEVLSAEQGRVHNERATLVDTPAGVVLITAHSHAGVATVLHETEPGHFPAAPGDAPFPMAIRLDVPEAGQLTYSWSYGSPGEQLVVRDVGTVRIADA